MKKKTKRVRSIIIIVLLAISTGVMTYLFIRENNLNKTYTDFGNTMVDSFSNAMSFVFCNQDFMIGNINDERCMKYLEIMLSDGEQLREHLGMGVEYQYIGGGI